MLEKSEHRIHFGVMAKGDAASRVKNVDWGKKSGQLRICKKMLYHS